MDHIERHELIRKVLNSGEWKHTWHIDISDFNMYPRILQIAEEKRDSAIRLLSDASTLIEELKLCIKQIEERRATELAEQAIIPAKRKIQTGEVFIIGDSHGKDE